MANIGHTTLDNLFFEHDLEASDPGRGSNQSRRSLALIQAINARLDPAAADAIIREIADQVLSNEYVRQNNPALLAALGADGWEWTGNGLIPSNPGPAALAPEITALEQGLAAAGFDVAATHYRQAVENYTDGNYEACNGQLRTFLEDLVQGAARNNGMHQIAGVQASLDYLRNRNV